MAPELPGATRHHPDVRLIAGRPDNIASSDFFSGTRCCCVDADGASILICDSNNHCIRGFGDGGLTTVVGAAGESGDVDGDAAVARLNSPVSICADRDVIYIAEAGNSKVKGFSVECGLWTLATLPSPGGLALAENGMSLYVATPGSIFVVSIASGAVDTYVDYIFNQPTAIYVFGEAKTLLVVDRGTECVQGVSAEGQVKPLINIPGLRDIAVEDNNSMLVLTTKTLLRASADGELTRVLSEQEEATSEDELAAPPLLVLPRECDIKLSIFNKPESVCIQGTRLVIADENCLRAVGGSWGSVVALVLEVGHQSLCVRRALSGDVVANVETANLEQLQQVVADIVRPRKFKLMWRSGGEVTVESLRSAFAPGPRDGAEVPAANFSIELLLDADRCRSAGVEMQRREAYLNDEDFCAVMGCSKQSFERLPKWKQLPLKKAVGLF